jgi:hypothetical protein
MGVSPAEIGSVCKAEKIMARKRTYRAQIEHLSLDNDLLRHPHQRSLRLILQLLFISNHDNGLLAWLCRIVGAEQMRVRRMMETLTRSWSKWDVGTGVASGEVGFP